MCEIICKKSEKGNRYLVLSINGVYVTFDSRIIEKVAMTVGISNIDLSKLGVDDVIKI